MRVSPWSDIQSPHERSGEQLTHFPSNTRPEEYRTERSKHVAEWRPSAAGCGINNLSCVSTDLLLITAPAQRFDCAGNKDDCTSGTCAERARVCVGGGELTNYVQRLGIRGGWKPPRRNDTAPARGWGCVQCTEAAPSVGWNIKTAMRLEGPLKYLLRWLALISRS